jgi:hypothetical protein
MLAERQLDSLAAIVASLNPLAKVPNARARACQRRAAAQPCPACHAPAHPVPDKPSQGAAGTRRALCPRRTGAQWRGPAAAAQVLACEQARVDIPTVFGPQVRPARPARSRTLRTAHPPLPRRARRARHRMLTCGAAQARGLVAHLNIEGQHRGAVAAARAAAADDQARPACGPCPSE